MPISAGGQLLGGQEILAGVSLSAGEAVRVSSNGKAYPIAQMSVSTPTLVDSGVQFKCAISRIDDTRALLFYKENGTNDMYVVILQIDETDESITIGTKALIHATPITTHGLVVLSPTKAISFYCMGTDLRAKVINIGSGTTISSVGTEQILSTGNATVSQVRLPAVVVASDTVVFSFERSNQGGIVAATVSGDTITPGTSVGTGANLAPTPGTWLVALSPTFLLYSVATTAGFAIYPVTLSGTVITVGQVVSYSDTTETDCYIALGPGNTFLAIGQSTGTTHVIPFYGPSEELASVRAGWNIGFDSSIVLPDAPDVGEGGFGFIGGHSYVQLITDLDYMYAMIYSIGSFSRGPSCMGRVFKDKTSTSWSGSDVMFLTPGRTIVCYGDILNSEQGYEFIPMGDLELQFSGVVQEAVTAGNPVNLVLRGGLLPVEAGGLEPGMEYIIGTDGLLAPHSGGDWGVVPPSRPSSALLYSSSVARALTPTLLQLYPSGLL